MRTLSGEASGTAAVYGHSVHTQTVHELAVHALTVRKRSVRTPSGEPSGTAGAGEWLRGWPINYDRLHMTMASSV